MVRQRSSLVLALATSLICAVAPLQVAQAGAIGSSGSSSGSPSGGVNQDSVSSPTPSNLGNNEDPFEDMANGCVNVGFSGPGKWNYLSDSDLNRTMDEAAAIGKYIRFDVEWSQVEEYRGEMAWWRVDRMVDAASSRGLTVIGVLTNTPAWARASDGNRNDLHTRPADPSEFARFAGQAASRYSGRVSNWEVWNEPNSPIFWNQDPNVGEYVELLKPTAKAIRSANPNATVITGGLASVWNRRGWINHQTWIDEMYRLGAADSFDVFGFHPYTFPHLPSRTDVRSGWQDMTNGLRDRMVASGDAGKQIWITEYGAPTGAAPGAVSPQRQADLIANAIEETNRKAFLGPLLVYSVRDSGYNTWDMEDNFGLFTPSWERKAGYDTVKTAIERNRC